MDLKQLEYFVKVVEEGNITSAARMLHMSQPPLSTQIKLLEEELGVVLFERGSRQIKLTDSGKMLYSHAVKLLQLSRVTKEEVIGCSMANSGTVRIGVVSSVICSFSANWIGKFSKTYPKVNFEVYEANTYELLEKLKSNIIHIAIVREPFVREGLVCKTLFDEGLVAIGDRGLFDNDKETVSFEELSNKHIILYRRWEEIIRKEFKNKGLEMHCYCMTDDARTTVHFADQGLGIGIVPAAGKDLIRNPDTVAKKIQECFVSSSVEMVYDPNVYMPECTKNFIKYIR